jgi:hypothetical protein
LLALPVPARADFALAYLARLGAGQARLLLAREPITPARIASLEPAERDNLESLTRALAFGESLGLARTTSYRDLVEGPKTGLVHVVTAAPANRVEAVTWWFPITGSVSYRGYFDPERADAFAAELADEGYDTYVRPAPLYSTLGWFDDPVPRAVLFWPEEQVVDTFLHELAPDCSSPRRGLRRGLLHLHRAPRDPGILADWLSPRAREAADEITFSRMLRSARRVASCRAGADPERARELRAPISRLPG